MTVVDYLTAACRLTQGAVLNRLVYNTMMNKIDKMKKPTLNPWVNVKPTTPSAMTQIFRTQKFLFRPGRCHSYIQPWVIFH